MKHIERLYTAIAYTKKHSYNVVVDRYSNGRYIVVNGPDFMIKRRYWRRDLSKVKRMKMYVDVDTNERITLQQIRDHYESLDADERDEYGSLENYIFVNMKENGGCLEEVL